MDFMKNWSIGKKLNVGLSTALIVPLVTATVVSMIFFGQKIQEQAIESINSDLKLAEIIYLNTLEEYRNTVENFATDRAIAISISLNLSSKLEETIKEKIHLPYDTVHILNDQQKIIAKGHAANYGNTINDKQAQKALLGESVVTVEALEPSFFEQEDMSEYDKNEFALSVAIPVYSQNEEVIGVILLKKLFSSFNQLIDKITDRIGIDAGIYFNDKLVISSLEPTDFSSNLPQKVLKLLKEGQVATVSDFLEHRYLGQIVPIFDINGNFAGGLMVRTSVWPFIMTLVLGIGTFLIIGALGMYLALFIKKLLERNISLPILELEKGTRLIADGNYEYEIKVTNKDELGTLAASFNKMAKDLESSYKKLEEYNLQLEDKVVERTQQLQEKNIEMEKVNMQLESTLDRLNPGVSQLIAREDQILGLVEATEFISDVVGYTTMNILLTEEYIGSIINEYYEKTHILLAKYRGFRDKTVGDQIVATFGIKKDYYDASQFHAFDAIANALETYQIIDDINEQIEGYIAVHREKLIVRLKSLYQIGDEYTIDKIKFRLRMGINTSISGDTEEINQMRMVMMGGNTGADYTGQGGALIYAARLESSGEANAIHIGENTYQAIKHFTNVQELESVTLKGLGIQKRYKILDMKDTFEFFPNNTTIQRYARNIPGWVHQMLDETIVAKVKIKEIEKIEKYINVSLKYYEHSSGYYLLNNIKTILLYILAIELNFKEEEITSMLAAGLLFGVSQISGNEMAIQMEDNILSNIPWSTEMIESEAHKIFQELNDTLLLDDQTINPKVQLIHFIHSYNNEVSDRTYLQNNLNKILSPSEALGKLTPMYSRPIINKAKEIFLS